MRRSRKANKPASVHIAYKETAELVLNNNQRVTTYFFSITIISNTGMTQSRKTGTKDIWKQKNTVTEKPDYLTVSTLFSRNIQTTPSNSDISMCQHQRFLP